MARSEESEELFDPSAVPDAGVRIGGSASCEHPGYRRVGSDGGTNIYFTCTGCSQTIIKFGSANQAGDAADRIEDPDLYPDAAEPTHDPLKKGLSLESTESTQRDGSEAQSTTAADRLSRLQHRIEQFAGRLRELFYPERK